MHVSRSRHKEAGTAPIARWSAQHRWDGRRIGSGRSDRLTSQPTFIHVCSCAVDACGSVVTRGAGGPTVSVDRGPWTVDSPARGRERDRTRSLAGARVTRRTPLPHTPGPEAVPVDSLRERLVEHRRLGARRTTRSMSRPPFIISAWSRRWASEVIPSSPCVNGPWEVLNILPLRAHLQCANVTDNVYLEG